MTKIPSMDEQMAEETRETTKPTDFYTNLVEKTPLTDLLAEANKGNTDLATANSGEQAVSFEGVGNLLGVEYSNVFERMLNTFYYHLISYSSFKKTYGCLKQLTDFIKRNPSISLNQQTASKLFYSRDHFNQYTEKLASQDPNRNLDIGDIVKVINCRKNMELFRNLFPPGVLDKDVLYDISTRELSFSLGSFGEIYGFFKQLLLVKSFTEKWINGEGCKFSFNNLYSPEDIEKIAIYDREELEFVPITKLDRVKLEEKHDLLNNFLGEKGNQDGRPQA